MAEGGVEFENPEFDRDDIDRDEVDNGFMDDTEFHRIMTNQYESLNNLTGETRETERNNLMKMTVKRFYDRNQEPQMRLIGFLEKIN